MKRYIFLLSAVLLFACNTQEKPDSIEVLKKEIMASHDTTMAEINYMARLRKQLKVASTDTLRMDSAALMDSYFALKKANDDMMQWMADFESPDQMTVSEEEKVKYLEGQKEKMLLIEKETMEAIQEAEQLTGK